MRVGDNYFHCNFKAGGLARFTYANHNYAGQFYALTSIFVSTASATVNGSKYLINACNANDGTFRSFTDDSLTVPTSGTIYELIML